jgi:xylulokinase
MWYRDNEPAMFAKIDKVIGTKDYINYRLTGRMCTDFSYASGSGVYDLLAWNYSGGLIEAAGLPAGIFPEALPSSEVIGELTAGAAGALGLRTGTRVVAGGVDNSCMALGARNIEEGRVYNSQGSSSWIAVSSGKPLLDESSRPYVFAHVMPGMFTSAVGVFSTGTSFRWVRDQFCADLAAEAEKSGADVYDLMTSLAAESPAGANRLLFNPSLAGGSSLDASPNIRGAFMGLDLGHTRADVIRAAMEGVAMALRVALDALRGLTDISGEMVVVGGGSRSELWRQIHADLYNMEVVKTNIDEQAAALGAAAVAAVGTGMWDGFGKIDEIHEVESTARPLSENREVYEKLLPVFVRASQFQSELGDMLDRL